MKFEDVIITENETVKQAIQRLEKVRCKVVYVVKGRKLLASVSDGDIRRYSLKNGDIDKSVSCIANYSPHAFGEYEKDKWLEVFKKTELYSIPIINLNGEIIAVVFRNGTMVRKQSKMNIPVVMMAGGKGTRLHPYTKILPKALIPIGDIPISEHIINRFYDSGCRNFFFLVNHKKGMIKSYYDNIEKDYCIKYIEEVEPLGTGGGLCLLKGMVKQDFVLTNCDILIDADYMSIYEMHKKKNNFITMVLSEYNQVIPYGVVSVDEDNRYEKMTEKPTLEYLINTGVYIVSARVIEEIQDNTIINFPEIIEKYRKAGENIGCYIVKESAYMDMGQFEELEKMKEKLNVN